MELLRANGTPATQLQPWYEILVADKVRRAMLLDYFSIEIDDNGLLKTLPDLLPGKYIKAKESEHRVYGKHCRLTFLFLLPLFKPVSLSLSRISSIYKTPKQVFF